MPHTVNREMTGPASDQLTIGSGLLSINVWLQPQGHVSPSSHLLFTHSGLIYPVPQLSS